MGELIEFPGSRRPSLDGLKAAIEIKFGVTYLEYIAFTMGSSGRDTEAIAKKMDRAMQKESLIFYTKGIKE